jgi:hypothetical protein
MKNKFYISEVYLQRNTAETICILIITKKTCIQYEVNMKHIVLT